MQEGSESNYAEYREMLVNGLVSQSLLVCTKVSANKHAWNTHHTPTVYCMDHA